MYGIENDVVSEENGDDDGIPDTEDIPSDVGMKAILNKL